MNSKLPFACIVLFLSCVSPVHKDSDISNAKIQYEHYLNEYYRGGDDSNIDSALKYNAFLLESDSSSIITYFNQLQLLSSCGRYDSALSFVSRIPEDLVLWFPEYKSYLCFKCKAIMAKESGDADSYKKHLDSIIILWEPVITDSIEKSDLLFSKSVDSIPEHLWFLYENYYEVVSHLHGKDTVERILFSKKAKYNWNSETYAIIRQNISCDAELSLP